MPFWLDFCLHFGPFPEKLMFLGTRSRRAPADSRQHPRGMQISFCTTTLRGLGAGICRRQLRSAPSPLRGSPERVRAGCSTLVPFPCTPLLVPLCCTTPHCTPFVGTLSLGLSAEGYLQVTCDSSRANRRGFGSHFRPPSFKNDPNFS